MRRFSLLLFLCFSLCLAGSAAATTKAKIKVVATLFPIYDFARQIGGDFIEATMLLPPGVEAHSFAPTPRDMMVIHKAQVFLYTGEAMEPWVADLLKGLDNTELHIVDTSVGLNHGFEEHRDHHQDQHGGVHHYGTRDPHIWLDPLKAMGMVRLVGAALIQADPEHAAIYQQNMDEYIGQLVGLDEFIKQSLAHCRINTIISGGHFAFGHFSERYHLKSVSAYGGFSPDAKPSPRAIATLIRTMKEVGSKVVYHEELLEPKVARIVAEETGATLLLLHGAHNVTAKERRSGVSYISIMKQNISRLQQGLQCQ